MNNRTISQADGKFFHAPGVHSISKVQEGSNSVGSSGHDDVVVVGVILQDTAGKLCCKGNSKLLVLLQHLCDESHLALILHTGQKRPQLKQVLQIPQVVPVATWVVKADRSEQEQGKRGGGREKERREEEGDDDGEEEEEQQQQRRTAATKGWQVRVSKVPQQHHNTAELHCAGHNSRLQGLGHVCEASPKACQHAVCVFHITHEFPRDKLEQPNAMAVL